MLSSGCSTGQMRSVAPHHHLLFVALMLFAAAAGAKVFLSTEQFLERVFGEQVPAPQVVWLQGALKERVERVLGHRYSKLRIRYWRHDETTAWVLEEIGKEQPITVGVVVRQGRIVSLEVLAYRESRGDEVRHRFFTRQFDHAGLDSGDRLDKSVDGITGATLSVRALKKLSRMALILHEHVTREKS